MQRKMDGRGSGAESDAYDSPWIHSRKTEQFLFSSQGEKWTDLRTHAHTEYWLRVSPPGLWISSTALQDIGLSKVGLKESLSNGESPEYLQM